MAVRNRAIYIVFCCSILFVTSLSSSIDVPFGQIDLGDARSGDAFQALLQQMDLRILPLQQEITSLQHEMTDMRNERQPLQQEISNLKNEMTDMRNKHAVEIQQLRNELVQLSAARVKPDENREETVKEDISVDDETPLMGENVERLDVDGRSRVLTRGLEGTHDSESEEDLSNLGGRSVQRDVISEIGASDRNQMSVPRRIRRQAEGPHVAFFAKLSAHATNLGVKQHVRFDNVVTNVGNGYDKNIGVFRAPVAGMYLISTTITTYQDSTGHFAIYINQRQETWFYLNGAQNTYDETSQTIIVHLNVGDDVTIRNLDDSRGALGQEHSIFSGVLLFEDDGQAAIVGKLMKDELDLLTCYRICTCLVYHIMSTLLQF